MAKPKHLSEVFVRKPRRAGHLAMLEAAGVAFPCAVGVRGLARRKREGDGATPIGSWPMRQLLYRLDRLPRPHTGLPTQAIAPADGWCDDPADRSYNRPVTLPYPASAEMLWRPDCVYDLIVVLGYNDAPPVGHRGSAIFFHLTTDDFGPTAGCVALRLRDMLKIVARCGPLTRLIVG